MARFSIEASTGPVALRNRPESVWVTSTPRSASSSRAAGPSSATVGSFSTAGARRRPCRARRRTSGLGQVDTLEPFVEQELVARGREQRRRRRFDTDTDHAPVELTQLVHERREIAVAGPEHEGGDVVALEAQLDRVDGHLDVGRVLADRSHTLRDLDELDVVAGEHAPVLVEARPVGVRAPDHHPSPLGERIGNGPEVELLQMELLLGADREVLVVEEQCDAFFVVAQAPLTISVSGTGAVARRARVSRGPRTRDTR